jgi:hypothetical protein
MAAPADGADVPLFKWRPGKTSSCGDPIMPCGLTVHELEAMISTRDMLPSDPQALMQLAAAAALALPSRGRQLPPGAAVTGLAAPYPGAKRDLDNLACLSCWRAMPGNAARQTVARLAALDKTFKPPHPRRCTLTTAAQLLNRLPLNSNACFRHRC